MAYLTQDSALNYLQGGQQQQGQQVDPTSYQPQGGSGGAFVGGASSGSTPAQGRGGQGSPWTNIDAYFGANKNNLGSGIQAVEQKSKGVLDTTKNNLNTAGTQAREGIAKESSEQIGLDKASKIVNERSDPTSIKSSLAANFDRPNYQFSQDAASQDWAKAYNDPNTYQTKRFDEYNKISGRGLTGGERSLQSQFDSLSGLLDPTIAAGKKAYGDLSTDIGNQAQSIGDEITKAESEYSKNKSGLDKYLRDTATTANTNINNTIASQEAQRAAIENKRLQDKQIADEAWSKVATKVGIQDPAAYINQLSPKDIENINYVVRTGKPVIGEAKAFNEIAPEIAKMIPYYKGQYQQGDTVNASNVKGRDYDIGTWNYLNDILGIGPKIEYKGGAKQSVWTPYKV